MILGHGAEWPGLPAGAAQYSHHECALSQASIRADTTADVARMQNFATTNKRNSHYYVVTAVDSVVCRAARYRPILEVGLCQTVHVVVG